MIDCQVCTTNKIGSVTEPIYVGLSGQVPMCRHCFQDVTGLPPSTDNRYNGPIPPAWKLTEPEPVPELLQPVVYLTTTITIEHKTSESEEIDAFAEFCTAIQIIVGHTPYLVRVETTKSL